MATANAELGPLYKVTDEDGSAQSHGKADIWPLPQGAVAGNWLEVAGERRNYRSYQRALRLYRRKDVKTWLGPVIWRAEVDAANGDAYADEWGIVARRARLLSRVAGWNARTARLFAADCAEHALLAERAAGREPEAVCWQAVTVARAFARGEVDVDALRCAEGTAVAAGLAALSAYAAAPRRMPAAQHAAITATRYAREAAGLAVADDVWSAARLAAWAAERHAEWAAAFSVRSRGERGERAAVAAASDAEKVWQTDRLFGYLDDRAVVREP